jgi:hypothetical protein
MTDFLKAIGFVRDISNTAKSFVNAREEFKINEVAIQLQGIALDLQSEMMVIQADYQNILRSCEDLKKQLEQYENWEKEKARYELIHSGNATFVYALKSEHHASEQIHWLCANCYNQNEKTILQRGPDGLRMRCPKCKMEIHPGEWPHWDKK